MLLFLEKQVNKNIDYKTFWGDMKLEVKPREAEKKSETKKLRREGFIPAVIYVRGKPSETIALSATDFGAYLRKIPSGRLSTTVFTLADEKGRTRKALVKGIEYNITNYNVVHLDFEELLEDVKLNVNVPIECVGVADCIGVKLGGVPRNVIRNLRVSCYPKDLPSYFELDIKDLGLFQSKRLSDLNIPSSIRPLADLKEVAVVVVKR